MDRVDFNNSSLRWTGESEGIFKLASILIFNNVNDNDLTYGLSQSVMAGNVYSKNILVKKPPYLFQVAGSTKDQTIYRSYLKRSLISNLIFKFKKNFISDTCGDNLIKQFNLKLITEKCKEICKFDDFFNCSEYFQISAKVKLNINDNKILIEFPINHINFKFDTKKWHVETGPVLLPVIFGFTSLNKLMPAFVFFNNFNKIDIFYDYPFGYRSMYFKNNGIISNIPCEIQIFRNIV